MKDPAVTAQESSRRPKAELDALLAEVRERGMARAVGQPIPGINASIALKLRACAEEISLRLGFK